MRSHRYICNTQQWTISTLWKPWLFIPESTFCRWYFCTFVYRMHFNGNEVFLLCCIPAFWSDLKVWIILLLTYFLYKLIPSSVAVTQLHLHLSFLNLLFSHLLIHLLDNHMQPSSLVHLLTPNRLIMDNSMFSQGNKFLRIPTSGY